jgi:uncharacterized membrane protein
MLAKIYIRSRLLGAILVAGLVALVLPSWMLLATRILCVWDAGMVFFLAATWFVMVRATPASMRLNAQRQDEGRLVILSLITTSACASLLAIGFVLGTGKTASVNVLTLHLSLTIVTIVGSWLLVHTIFALHYAHAYYQPTPENSQDGDAGGLDFPSDWEPDYWDFLYFSFVIGMTSQVSDVDVTSRVMRRLTLIHGVLSFFFNTAILAMSINIIAGLI